jgi:regulator of protease activity HflC (stomatin/prohibitin superfamily)
LPWPIDRVYRFNVGEVKSFNVGFVPDPNKVDDTTILWTVPHYKEEFNFLVARRDQSSATETNEPGNSQSVPVNLLDAGIPVQFRIADIRAWAYGQADSQMFLEQIATREVVRYLASADLLDIMSIGRAQASEDLRKSIQARADQLHLGVEILFVGLQDIHPPTSVASEFEAVNGAAQDVQAKVLSAEGKTNRIVLLAHADGTAKIRAAEGAAMRSTTNAAARGAQFANQLAAYQVAPEVYTNRLHLLTVGRALAGTRKYIIGPTNTHNVFQIDLLEKGQPSLLDVTPDANKK